MSSFFTFYPLLKKWSILLPPFIILNGWIVQSIFAHVMQSPSLQSHLGGVSNTFEKWKYGDFGVQWLIYGSVAWLLTAHYRRGSISAEESEDQEHSAYIHSTRIHLVSGLVVWLLLQDITFRYILNSLWFYGTIWERMLGEQWMPSNSDTSLNGSDALVQYWEWAHLTWAIRPLWPFLVVLLLSYGWSRFYQVVLLRLNGASHHFGQ